MIVLLKRPSDNVRGLELWNHLVRGWCGVVDILLEKSNCFSLVKVSPKFKVQKQVTPPYRISPSRDSAGSGHLILQVQGAWSRRESHG